MKLAALARKMAGVATYLAHLRERGEEDGTDWEQIEALMTEISQLCEAMQERAAEEGVLIDEHLRQ